MTEQEQAFRAHLNRDIKAPKFILGSRVKSLGILSQQSIGRVIEIRHPSVYLMQYPQVAEIYGAKLPDWYNKHIYTVVLDILSNNMIDQSGVNAVSMMYPEDELEPCEDWAGDIERAINENIKDLQ